MNPHKLVVGDLIVFKESPTCWKRKAIRHAFIVCQDAREFMDYMIRCKRRFKIEVIDEFGHPWISVKKLGKHGYEYHTWAVTENDGWVLVKRATLK